MQQRKENGHIAHFSMPLTTFNLWPFTKHLCSLTCVSYTCAWIEAILNFDNFSIQRELYEIIFFPGLVRSTITVNVASQSTWVNYGDNYTANCNIPGLDALEISQLSVKWFHNGQHLTSQCLLLSAEIKQKYSCITVTPEWNNISLLLTVKSNCWLNTLVTRSD